MRPTHAFAAAGALILAACSGAQTGVAPQAAPPAAEPVGYVIEEVATGLSFPWSIAFLPDGDMLVAERDGNLRLIDDGALRAEPVSGVPAAYVDNQAGMFEVALHPRFEENGQVYLTLATGTQAANRTTLVRGRYQDGALTDVETLFQASPDKRGGAHFGGRLLFLPDDTLLLTLGDGFAYREEAQSLDTDLGKIVRLTLDGAPAADNPFNGQAGARAEVFSYGHRNVQGITRDPVSGRIYATEHGPRGGDELNVLSAGANYGWPVITYGVDYSGAVISPFTERDGMEQPLVYWVPSIAPSSMVFYSGDAFPQWRGDILVSALTGAPTTPHVRRVDLDENGAVVGQEQLFLEVGERLRDVAQAPDGSIYLLTDAPDGRVLRVRPQS
jgi:glucose/arabinose dehydrogenase